MNEETILQIETESAATSAPSVEEVPASSVFVAENDYFPYDVGETTEVVVQDTLFTKPLDEYTPTEGYLCLLFVLAFFVALYKIFVR